MNNLDTSKLKSAKNEAKARLDDLIHGNQIYRFAAKVYGYDDATEHTGGVR